MSVRDICELGALMEAEEADGFNLEAEIIRLGNEMKLSEQRLEQERINLTRKVSEFKEQEEKSDMLDDRFRLIAAFVEESHVQLENKIKTKREEVEKIVKETLTFQKTFEESIDEIGEKIDALEVTVENKVGKPRMEDVYQATLEAQQRVEALEERFVAIK